MAFNAELSVIHALAFLMSLFAVIIALCCIAVQFASGHHSTNDDLEKAIAKKLSEESRFEQSLVKALLEDYSATLKEVGRRDNVTLLTGTILITASFILLGNAISARHSSVDAFAFASLGLYMIWLLFLHDTAKKLNKLSFERARAIEGALTKHFGYSYGIHSYITKKTADGTVWWLRMVRRIFWHVILLLLASSWMLLSISLA